MLEEGEIDTLPDSRSNSDILSPVDLRNESSLDITGATYSPSIEWPGDTDPTPVTPPFADVYAYEPAGDPRASSTSLRLVVQHSAILRKNQRLALLDGFTEIQIGRDIAPAGSDTPRIRLKEMEVSKVHATIYWDQDRTHWSVVDMGSKHGTFIQSSAVPPPGGPAAQGSDGKGFRLSAPRVASMPRALRHFDRLTIGGTTFIIHIHEDRTPCTACSPQGDEEIPLFLHRAVDSSAGASKKRDFEEFAANNTESTSARDRDPKKALTMLKRTLLSSSKNLAPTPSGSRGQYVDRSARRRALHPDRSPATTPSADRSPLPSPSVSAPATPPSPAAPLSATNIGHRLLLKQGWQPGTALGEASSDNAGLVVPLDTPTTVGRAGLGASARLASASSALQEGDWKDAGKRRRWAETRESLDGV
ncbi:hypothetical protein DICSQDRAFT_99923 [Dichomitus squalens LYAD-421 SS1]|uniref:uncharacterized protein n=1 Tax=Dichomitus squalens (strain LYAD-421) TaxID=732165 RepID=UPI0004412DDE|nr:uncharacterized protein DICSQDRAFT_99923 [Dichomitus squalens LYAD-421 SS1]EJF64661.1 hypothetical protein DICSQDRAFT_99923 [Dichomitus squalens LYAD-421 SS1]